MKDNYEQQLLSNWEDAFRQGLLTFWVFLALDRNQLSVSELKDEVEKLSKGTYSAAAQTLYRLLRKQYDLELVDYEEVESKGGPVKKVYRLSSLGSKLLRKFATKNIGLFYQDEVKKLIKDIKYETK